jgi:hypothetical protein
MLAIAMRAGEAERGPWVDRYYQGDSNGTPTPAVLGLEAWFAAFMPASC